MSPLGILPRPKDDEATTAAFPKRIIAGRIGNVHSRRPDSADAGHPAFGQELRSVLTARLFRAIRCFFPQTTDATGSVARRRGRRRRRLSSGFGHRTFCRSFYRPAVFTALSTLPVNRLLEKLRITLALHDETFFVSIAWITIHKPLPGLPGKQSILAPAGGSSVGEAPWIASSRRSSQRPYPPTPPLFATPHPTALASSMPASSAPPKAGEQFSQSLRVSEKEPF